MNNKIPTGIMHKPKPMAWAELTPLSEHKERDAKGIKTEIVLIGSKSEPLPISRATTDLRRAYPYIFDCATYVKTHHSDRIETDIFYSRFTMPYKIFFDYCLDYCNEQTQYLKEEIYKLMKGQPAKYIKVSKDRTIFAQPIMITLSYTDLKTGKEKRITNIGHDIKVDMVQIQILKELLDVSHGRLNLPKAFYAKTRHFFNIMREQARPLLEAENDYRKLIKQAKSLCVDPVTTNEAVFFAERLVALAEDLKTIEPEQGGFYKICLALEYILANKKRGVTVQEYNLLNLCEKCAQEYIQKKNGKLYLHRGKNVFIYGKLIGGFINILPEKEKRIIGIDTITICKNPKRGRTLFVRFFPLGR